YSREPDFVKIAEGMGVEAYRADKPEEIHGTLEKALEQPGPALIDFRIPQEAMVMPMVMPGDAIDKMHFN
ncbi:MAG: thiamine pyrophosphate-dependent enzyme, partial [Synergistaceae bacterium]